MFVANLTRLFQIAEAAADRMGLLQDALNAADALLMALDEATAKPTATNLAAVEAAEQRYRESRQAVDGARS